MFRVQQSACFSLPTKESNIERHYNAARKELHNASLLNEHAILGYDKITRITKEATK